MKRRRVTILRKGLFVIALPLVYQALFIGLLLKRQTDQIEAQRWAMHTKGVIEKTEHIFRVLISTHSDFRGYLLTGKQEFVQDINQNESELQREFPELEALIQDNPAQKERFQRVLEAAHARLDFQREIVADFQKKGSKYTSDEVRDLRGKQLIDRLRHELEAFRAAEEKLDSARLEKLQKDARTQNWLLVGGLIVNVGIGALAAMMFSREISNRIEVVTANTRRIAEDQELPSLVPGSDEIRELDEQFHALAQNLKSARLRERVYQEALERRANDLMKANRDLGQKNQEIEMFVYSVSHDLRSPLVNLQGFSRELGHARGELTAIVKRELTPADRQRALALVDTDMGESIHYIQTAVTRLSSIIDALLRLSRAGRVEYHPKAVELAPIIHRIVEAMRGTIAERGAEVVIAELPPVWGDPTALEQIFANLIGNAVNYLDPKRPGRIEVGAVEREVEGVEKPRTYFVKDNGLGIGEDYLDKVFAIFQRIHGDVAIGEGVGLALVRRVVERHGGRVWVESIEGVGSTFFVAFPAEPQQSPLAAVAPRKERINVPVPHS